jgi:phage-related protein
VLESESDLKPLEWLGSSRRDIRDLPDSVQRSFGYGLYRVQQGETPSISKTFKGQIQELREDDDQNRTYRAVYIAAFAEAVYILHVFNKISPDGISTSRRDVDLINERFAEAKARHEELRKGKPQ